MLHNIHTAVVGAGFIGPVHVEALRRLGVTITGILGVDDKESTSAQQKLGLPKAEATNQVLFLSEKARALAGLQRFDDAVQSVDRALLVAGENNKQIVRHLRVRLLTMASQRLFSTVAMSALLSSTRSA